MLNANIIEALFNKVLQTNNHFLKLIKKNFKTKNLKNHFFSHKALNKEINYLIFN
jgi:hypothetical protein